MRGDDGFKWPEQTGDISSFEGIEDEDSGLAKTAASDAARPDVTSGAGRPIYRYSGRDSQRFARRGRSFTRRFPIWFYAVLAVLVVAFVCIGLAINHGGNRVDKDAVAADEALTQQAAEQVASMTTEQKVAQLILCTPTELTGIEGATETGDITRQALATYPVGGIVLDSTNIIDSTQLATFITDLKTASPSLFIGVSEAGGEFSTLVNAGVVEGGDVGNEATIGATNDSTRAYSAGYTIGGYLKNLGFNMNLAPNAGVLSEGQSNPALFGSNASLVADMVSNEVAGLEGQGVSSVVGYFPGTASVVTDEATGLSSSSRTLSELKSSDMVPFESAVSAGCDFIMVCSEPFTEITGDVPATLSSEMVTEQLREGLGYEGVIVSGTLTATCITATRSSDQAAVEAVLAGCDMVYCAGDVATVYNALLSAVSSGQISADELDEHVTRITKVKLSHS